MDHARFIYGLEYEIHERWAMESLRLPLVLGALGGDLHRRERGSSPTPSERV